MSNIVANQLYTNKQFENEILMNEPTIFTLNYSKIKINKLQRSIFPKEDPQTKFLQADRKIFINKTQIEGLVQNSPCIFYSEQVVIGKHIGFLYSEGWNSNKQVHIIGQPKLAFLRESN